MEDGADSLSRAPGIDLQSGEAIKAQRVARCEDSARVGHIQRELDRRAVEQLVDQEDVGVASYRGVHGAPESIARQDGNRGEGW